MNKLPKEITIGDKYSPAMEITSQEEADDYFQLLIEHTMSFDNELAEAEQIERSNLGYYAGYYSHEVRDRVERLFRCEHPFFGSITEK